MMFEFDRCSIKWCSTHHYWLLTYQVWNTGNQIQTVLTNWTTFSLIVMGRTPFYRTSFFEHQTNSNTLFLASNEWTSNFKPNRDFTRFTKLLIKLTQKSFFRTSNELECVHLLVIELKHPIFASNEQTSNLIIKPSLDLLNYSSNRLEHRFKHVHLLVIEPEHPIFGFERSIIKLRT